MNTGEQRLTFNKICISVVGASATYYKTRKTADLIRWEQAFREAFDAVQTREERRMLMNYAPPTGTSAFNFAGQALATA